MGLRSLSCAMGLVVAAVALAHGVSCTSNNNNNTGVDCTTYCQNVATTCEGGTSQYADQPTCMRLCAAMAGGEAGVGGSDTVACRNVQLQNALDDNPMNLYNDCVASGPSSTQCPDPCTAFCDLDMTLCAGMNGYDGSADCVATCKTWPQTFTGQLIGSTGDNLECRTYHLELSQAGVTVSDVQAAMAVHCPHTGRVSARCFNTDGGTGDAAGDAPTD